MARRTFAPTGNTRRSRTRSRVSSFISTALRQLKRCVKPAFSQETSGWTHSVKRLLRTHLANIWRLDAIWDGTRLHVLEVNTLPFLGAPSGVMATSFRAAGMSHY